MPTEFVPDLASALLIQACVKAKKCKLALLGTHKLEKTFGGSSPLAQGNADLRVALDEEYTCILAALQEAYAMEGETFPVIPPPPDPVDFSTGGAALDAVQSDFNLDSPLGFMGNVVQVEFDANDFPTKIILLD